MPFTFNQKSRTINEKLNIFRIGLQKLCLWNLGTHLTSQNTVSGDCWYTIISSDSNNNGYI